MSLAETSNGFRILVADPLDPAGLDMLRSSGAEVVLLADGDRENLPELLPEFDALVVRSRTIVDADLLRAGRRLKVVGRAGIGVDNIDVGAATELGVLVINAPTANLLSATEHTFALVLALARNIPAAHASVRRGEWRRKDFVGVELQDKVMGIIGFGQIGQRVAARARAFEMEVVAYDPYLDPLVARRLDVELLDLSEVLSRADVVTLHVPLTEQTRGLIGAQQLALLKPDALLVNCSRGGVIDERALLQALEEGSLGGAALDVFAEEPPKNLDLASHPKVIVTPHIGAQTREAQERISTETARMVLAALNGSLAVPAVNLPFRAAGASGEPFLHLGEQLGQLASSLLHSGVGQIQVDVWGIEDAVARPVSVAVVKGALTPFLGEAVNYVNAEKVAAARGIEVVRSSHAEHAEYPHLVRVRLTGHEGEVEVAGTVFGERDPRVVRIRGFQLEFRPAGRLLVIRNRDVPGVVGSLGTTLGEAGVNIAEIHLARTRDRAHAMAVIRVDQEPSQSQLEKLASLEGIDSVELVDLGRSQG